MSEDVVGFMRSQQKRDRDNNGESLVEITSKDVDGDVEVVWKGTPNAFLSLLEFWAASEAKQR